jgi:plastocyanin
MHDDNRHEGRWNMKRSGRLIGIAAMVIVIVGVVGAAALSRSWGDETSDPRARTSGAVSQITITGQDIRFDPSELRMQVGEPVRLVFINEGSIDHDVSILGIVSSDNVDEASGHADGTSDGHGSSHSVDMMSPGTVHLAAAPGQRASVEFTPKAGVFDVICTIVGHVEAGMSGIVIAE